MTQKKVVGFVFISLMLVSLVAGFVSAQSGVAPNENIFSSLAESIKSLFEEGGTKNLKGFLVNPLITKTLFFLLVLIIIYSVSEYLPFFENKGFMAFIFSGIVAFLSVIRITPEFIETIFYSYNALGITLTAIIPFFAIAAVSKKSFEKGHVILSKILWLAFILALIYVFFTAPNLTNAAIASYSIVILAGIFMFFKENRVYMSLFKATLSGDLSRINSSNKAILAAKVSKLHDELSAPGLSEEQRKKIKDEISSLEGMYTS